MGSKTKRSEKKKKEFGELNNLKIKDPWEKIRRKFNKKGMTHIDDPILDIK